MKITILLGAFLPCPPLEGGAVEKMWFELAKKFHEKGCEVQIISKKFKTLEDGKDEFGIHHDRILGFKTPISIITRLLQDFIYTINGLRTVAKDSDIIITNTFWAPILAQKKLKKKICIDVARVPKGQLKLYKGVGVFRANSKPVQDAIIKEIGSDENIICIPNPLPFVISNINILENKKKTLLFVGRVHPEKGIELLINAFKKVDRKDWLLKIVGPYDISGGGGGEKYYQELLKLSQGFKIQIIGPIYDKDELMNEYIQSSIFIYPSLAEKGETFGLAPLEAMSCGCVPILSKLACFNDFVINEYNGMYFDHRADDNSNILANKIRYLIDNDALREELSNNAINVNKTHSSSYVADLFLTEFNKIMRK